MGEIPDDVRSSAALAVGTWADPSGELVSRVATAILAERKSCAYVALEYGEGHSSSHKLAGHAIAMKILFGANKPA